MKVRKIKKTISVILAIALIIGCVFSLGTTAIAYTDESLLTGATTVNGESYEIGDKVVYTAYLQSDELITGVDAKLSYDSSILEISQESMTSSAITSIPTLASHGTQLINYAPYTGEKAIYVNAYDITRPYDFSQQDTVLMTVTFNVVGAGTTTLECTIRELMSNREEYGFYMPVEQYTINNVAQKPLTPQTTYFAITPDMASGGFSSFATSLKVKTIDDEGNETIGSINSEIVQVQWQADMTAFDTTYSLNSTILQFDYLSNVVSIKFYIDGQENSAKASTPLYSPVDEKVFYINDYTSYDSSTVNASDLLIDKEYDVTIQYPNLNDGLGQQVITRVDKVYISADIRKVAISNDRYNDYNFTETSGDVDNVISDTLLTADAKIKTYHISLPVDALSSQSPFYSNATLEAISGTKIKAISEDLDPTMYEAYNINYPIYNKEELASTKYVDQYTANIQYGKTIWIEAPKTVDSGAIFVGWYNVDENLFVSYENDFKFILTQNTSLVPIYSDNNNAEVMVSDTPYALAENPLYEVLVDELGIAKIKFTFPISYITPSDVVGAEYKVRILVVEEGESYNLDAQWTVENVSLTNDVNAQDRINYYLTANYFDELGNTNNMTIYLQPYIEYNGLDTRLDDNAVVQATYNYLNK